MTACNETQKLSGKKAVGATLAGVLAVGMVPAAAFATDEAPESGIETLAIAPADAFDAGTITGITINGKSYSGAALKSISLVNDKAYTIAVTQVTLADGTVVDTSNSEADYYTVKIAGPATANPIAKDAKPGAYSVTVAAGSNTPYKGGETSASVDIAITAPSIQGATLFNKIGGNTDVTKNSFFYTGKSQKDTIGVALDGKEITPKGIVFYESDKLTTVAAPTAAGTYWAKITSDQDATAEVQFTISPLNLSTAEIVMNDTSATTIAISDIQSINGISTTGNFNLTAADLALQVTSGGAGMTDNGQYTCLISAAENQSNVTGSKSVPFARVGAPATFKYNADAWKSAMTVDLAAGGSFDVSKITAEYGAGPTSVPADDIDVTITNAAGRTVTAATMNSTPGVYTVTAAVDAAALSYAAGGKATCTVTVVEDTLVNADIYVTYKGNVADSVATTYDGKNVLDDIKVTVLDADGNALKQGTDYTIEVTDDNDGNKVVSQVVNAGAYTLTIKSDSYAFNNSADSQVSIEVDQVTAATTRVAGTITVANGSSGDVTFLPFSGQAITPVIEYDTGEVDADGNAIWATLPAEAYTAAYTYSKTSADTQAAVEQINKAGYYTVTLAKNDDDPMGDNFNIIDTAVSNAKTGALLFVSDERFFVDVPSSAWFYEDVYKAAELGYVKGYGDTKLFGPDNAIKRGDVAVILFRMAGGQEVAGSYQTPFSDVDSDAYWAQAIAWAADAKIINGYGDTGAFGPSDTVTREQFAKMLGAYAQAVDNYTAVVDPAAELKAYVDGSSVSSWATAYMAWATDNGYMNGYGDTKVLDPAGNVTRAQVAKMTVAYQPTPLSTDIETPTA